MPTPNSIGDELGWPNMTDEERAWLLKQIKDAKPEFIPCPAYNDIPLIYGTAGTEKDLNPEILFEQPDPAKDGWGYIAGVDATDKNSKVSIMMYLKSTAGLIVYNPTRMVNIKPLFGDYRFSNPHTSQFWLDIRKLQRRTMRILPATVQVLLILWLLPLFLWVGWKFDATYFTTIGWLFTFVFSWTARVWLKDRYNL